MHDGIEVQNGDNDNEFRYGMEFAMLATRPNTMRNNRVILDVAAVPADKGYGGEARIAVDMIGRIVADEHVRCDGVCYDGAFRGKTAVPMTELGHSVDVDEHADKPAWFY